MCLKPDTTYEQKEEEIIEFYRSGKLSFEELLRTLVANRKHWEEIERKRWED